MKDFEKASFPLFYYSESANPTTPPRSSSSQICSEQAVFSSQMKADIVFFPIFVVDIRSIALWQK